MKQLCAWFLAVLATAPVSAQGIRIADAQGGGIFDSLQSAIDAAQEGDVLLIGPGSYPLATIDGKGLTLAGPSSGGVTIDGGLDIRNIATVVVVSNVDVVAPSRSAIRIRDCTGIVRLQRGSAIATGDHTTSAFGLLIERARGVACTDANYRGGESGHGVRVVDSKLALYDCTCRGGSGEDSPTGGTDGGSGVEASGGTSLFVSGGSNTGGRGGNGGNYPGGDGGDGVSAPAPVVAAVLASAASGGAPGTTTQQPPVAGVPFAGPIAFLSGPSRSLDAALIVSDGGAPTVVARGDANERVFAVAQRTPRHVLAIALDGVWLVKRPFFLSNVPLGVLSVGGFGTFPYPVPPLAATASAETRHVQGLHVDPAGGVHLSNAVSVVTLNRDVGPDCDGNGVSDYVDILEGAAADADGDWIPDSCQMPYGGPVWYVDAAAPGGGNGSTNMPFQTLRGAFDDALDGHEIVIADGTYTGPDNRDLDYTDRHLVVRSANGPAATIIDCEDSGRAFHFLDAGFGSVLRGVTVVNGLAGPSAVNPGTVGGAVLVGWDAYPIIEDCVFRSCRAPQQGGAIYALGRTVVRDCTFEDNTASNGGALWVRNSASTIVGCRLVRNTAFGRGGGLYLTAQNWGGGREAVVSHNVFLENTAAQGGGVYATWQSYDYQQWFTNCLFAGNSATRGGAIQVEECGDVLISQCTFAGNTSVDQGGALHSTGHYGVGTWDIRVANTVFWGNASANGLGDVIAHDSTAGGSTGETRVTLLASSIETGLSAVHASGPTTFGPGNVFQNPLFVDPDGPDNDPLTFDDNDYRLLPGSPVIDAAYRAEALADLLDLDGDLDTAEPEPFDLLFADRFVDIPSVPDTGVGAPPLPDMGCHERQL